MKKFSLKDVTPLTKDEKNLLTGGFQRVKTLPIVTMSESNTNCYGHAIASEQVAEDSNTNCHKSCGCG